MKTKKLSTKIQSKRRGGYKGYRNADGLTPRQALDFYKSELSKLELDKQRGLLARISDIECRDKEQNEIILSDMQSLPDKLCFVLSGKIFSVDAVRETVRKTVFEMLTAWKNSGIGCLNDLNGKKHE